MFFSLQEHGRGDMGLWSAHVRHPSLGLVLPCNYALHGLHCLWIQVCKFLFMQVPLLRCLKLHKVTDPCVFLDELPGVSVIKPLMGVDPFLKCNLESYFTIIYPKFELLFCVQDDQDPAISLVQKLTERYPNVDCTLFIGGKDGIVNPMIHNMAPAYENCKYSTIWIATSRIEANTDMLLDMVGKLQLPNVALVHQLPFTVDNLGFCAAVEKCRFEAVLGILNLVRSALFRMLHIPRGFHHQLAALPALQNVANTTIASFKDRLVRWLRLRMNMVPPVACFLEPLGECFVLGVYASWSACYLFEVNPYLWFIGHTCVWCMADYIHLLQVQGGPLPFSKLTYIGAWLVRELLYFIVYFEAVIDVRHIIWGNRTYRLSHFGRTVEKVPDKSAFLI
ncbi:hypothetical protein LSH36_104g00036 [Paralvinella palmiformis]|uniref:ceramide glucosyltransferase n=1 Tax=Paralvinella palmiformis TaxID=53620 RepID=A0AAD9JZG0_9ANNE|nr:hypothetical protein LSH36_104g00036 [Paralvinella palmiformis]